MQGELAEMAFETVSNSSITIRAREVTPAATRAGTECGVGVADVEELDPRGAAVCVTIFVPPRDHAAVALDSGEGTENGVDVVRAEERFPHGAAASAKIRAPTWPRCRRPWQRRRRRLWSGCGRRRGAGPARRGKITQGLMVRPGLARSVTPPDMAHSQKIRLRVITLGLMARPGLACSRRVRLQLIMLDLMARRSKACPRKMSQVKSSTMDPGPAEIT